jgi:hypothetical protein
VFHANPDRLNHGHAHKRPPGFERRGILRCAPDPIDRRRVREDWRSSALRTKQPGSRRARAGRQESGTPLFDRLGIP